jgi:ABC-type lipoprotein release transport system permease subunit
MKAFELVRKSLWHYRRSHAGVLLGTVLAAVVLTGSLLVGDSVDGSLRTFARQRLGGIRHAMYTPNRFFAADLAGRISEDAAAMLQLRGMALNGEAQVNRVQVNGCDSRFWAFADMEFQLQAGEVALNEKLADSLGVKVGDEVSLRIEKPGLLPRDAPLSSQEDGGSVRALFTVVRILGDDELGRFSLSANQVVPYNAFVNLQWLSDRIEREGAANMLLTKQDHPDSILSSVWLPSDFGLRFVEEGGVLQMESDSIYLEPEAARAAQTVAGARGTLTYLVNSLSANGRTTPYSFVLAKEAPGGTSPLSTGDNGIIISEWLAETLSASTGDTVLVKYFELLPSGGFEERERTFKVRSVVSMKKLERERTLAPPFPGLTDVDRCADWDVGIPMDEELLEDKQNEVYWEMYRQTPKAIISLKSGQSMWSNRFGSLTSVRWSKDARAEQQFRENFDPSAAGYAFEPVQAQALAAVDNAMDFGQLFVGMSFFLIVAALMLTALLFVFVIQRRAEEMGILLATGWSHARVRRCLLLEGLVVAVIGSAAGAVIGIGYTWLLILGLSSYWTGAIANSSVGLYVDPATVWTGAVSSLICAQAAIAAAIWRQAGHPARELLMADFTQPLNVDGKTRSVAAKHKRMLRLYWLLPVISIGIISYTLAADPEQVTLPFFVAGALLLASGILFCGLMMQRLEWMEQRPGIGLLALKNIIRRRGRSMTVIGLLAVGCFLVFAVSSMKEDIAAHADESSSGTGGFRWFGTSTLPIHDSLSDVGLRVRDGDDASCLNLNRAQVPRLLGVDPDTLSNRRAFIRKDDVWQLLKRKLPDGMVPALVGDTDTALWGMEASVGVEKGDVLEYTDEAGALFKIKLVGTLPMRLSVFQGSLLIAESGFVERFPGEEGYRMFLWSGDPEAQSGRGRSDMLREYERYGLDIVPTLDRLMEFYAVESTYLSMFLVLGIMGLVVGSAGMGIVVLRNVQDRRSELALLRAVGYQSVHLRRMLFIEHGLLIAAGLGIGLLSAAVAMMPALSASGARTSIGFHAGLILAVAGCSVVCMAIAVRGSMKGDALRGLRNE